MSDRTITVKAKSRNASLNEVNRRLAESFFVGEYTYKNYLLYQGNEFWIDAELQGIKLPSKNIYRPLELTVSYYSADPFWKSVDNYGKNIAAVNPRFGFPYIQTSAINVIASVFNFAKEVVIENDGDVETFCTAVITAKGEVVNPKIIQGTNFVKINDTLQLEDVVVIDFEKLTVAKNDVNCIQNVDKNSSFTDMALKVGDTTISFDADNGDADMDVYIYYNKKYVGL